MPYSKTTWVNNITPLNATNMNNIEDGIYNVTNNSDTNTTNIGDLTNLDTTAKTDLVASINEVNSNLSIPYTNSEIDTLLEVSE